jgi:hypothetical protein
VSCSAWLRFDAVLAEITADAAWPDIPATAAAVAQQF